MTNRPTRRRLAAAALAIGFALVSAVGLTGCGASRGSEAPAAYAPMPTDPPKDVAPKPGQRYVAAQFKQGE